LVPGAPVETIACTGHIPQVERPAKFVKALNAVLEELAGSAAITP
jgi:pimeloyl-ACP methyl ester carboxylesterase